MSFVTPAPFTYLSSRSAYPLNGLVALYNIANSSCYTSGSSTINDLSGQGNTLAISASSDITYIAVSSSLQFNTKTTTAAYGQIKSNNELVYNGTYPLHTTSSQFTIVNFVQSSGDGSSDYQPFWYIGNTTYSGTIYKQIMLANWASDSPYKIGVGSQFFSSANDYFNAYYSSGLGGLFTWGALGSDPAYGYRKWSLQSYAKSSQTNEFNLNIAIRGYNAASTWVSSSLTVVPLSTGSYPRTNGGDAQTTYQTNLSNSYLYMGKTPAAQPVYGILPTFQFGGMAIYNRALATDEVNRLWNYFINGRTP